MEDRCEFKNCRYFDVKLILGDSSKYIHYECVTCTHLDIKDNYVAKEE